jgi:eukaryotic-like serine/threonine-protein kinase
MTAGVEHGFAGYELIEEVGCGASGWVYKALEPGLSRTIALKVLAPRLSHDGEFMERFLHEASLASRLHHPHLVGMHAAGECDGIFFVAMEYVEGESLRCRLDRKGRMDAAEAVAICTYVAQALSCAWEETGLVHCDIKPENIFLSRQGVVKVGDLGLAEAVVLSLTVGGFPPSLAPYMSPEQALGAEDLDFRSDVYSLGCTLHHMVLGRPPFMADDLMALLLKHVGEALPDPRNFWPACPAPLARLIRRMLAKQRDERHGSYDELLAELAVVDDSLSGIERPTALVGALTP